ncbi:MAG: glutathione S-transferase family protein [Phormidesmis sp.]
MSSLQIPSIDLYTYALSPYGMKVYWTLIYKNLPFKLHYVHPISQKEIKFTKQKVVPVLKIDDEWKLDSTLICLWLDEQNPSLGFLGYEESQRKDVLAADQWITDTIIPLAFRSAIDNGGDGLAYRNGRKLFAAVAQTSGGVPSLLQYFWPIVTRQVKYVTREVAKLDAYKSIEAVRKDIEENFISRLNKTGFIAGTKTLSYADIVAFSQITMATALGMEGQLNTATPEILQWHRRMVDALPDNPKPALIPGWNPYAEVNNI